MNEYEYTETHENLKLVCQTAELRARGCGCWYLIKRDARPHTAFDTEAGVRRWADERGLTLTAGALDARGVFAVHKISGVYRSSRIMTDDLTDVERAIEGIMSRTLSNGDYVVANIVTDPDGVRRVRTLNPNVNARSVFDYRESNRMTGGNWSSLECA